LLVVAYCLSFGGRWHFMLDNLSSFQAQFSAGFLVLLALTSMARTKIWIGATSVCLIVTLVQLAPWYAPMHPASAAGDDDRIKIVSSNVLARHTTGRRLAELVGKELPDVVGVVELTPRVVESLSVMRESYPHFIEVPDDGTSGLGLYSRLPIFDARLLELGPRPVITATLVVNRTTIEVILAHPHAPMYAGWARSRNEQLQLLASHIRDSGRPTIVLGDLNIAMWSPYYRDFAAVSGLRNAREGHGIGGSWPALFGLAVPIDHILASPEIELANFRVLPSIGSDHFPIAAELGIPKQI
jgi:endonuclease/exonuclease/phosphatase (EEP) superfamily protein YafD